MPLTENCVHTASMSLKFGTNKMIVILRLKFSPSDYFSDDLETLFDQNVTYQKLGFLGFNVSYLVNRERKKNCCSRSYKTVAFLLYF